MRQTTTVLLATLLLAGGAIGCSKSGDDNAKDCATALTERTGGNSTDKPTVSEAKERVDALDETLAGMVRSGYESQANAAFAKLEKKTEASGKERPEACKSLAKDDYTALQMATAINGLGWTGEGGKFDKLKMVENLGS